ncbi:MULTISPECIES: DUF5810 domain-containing protein [Haloferax]|uniref:Uncharacterized protein n=2 Tax=Haloferax TaxID=2251 RepID=A0A6G1Z193_9EURY|nr:MULTISPECIES: DUF5810 domain-containing protein [Haloferax]KAB1187406.1 hypothetical protein Hfx1149_04925 [Haloferax sp. CBA1149]MRW80054.1 hypothetical protein [Haloferax marinisediminis]
MGYACPVCDAPQRDETHLANHLALQAIVHSDDHETWLDEHAPEWASMNAERLGPVVADLADEHEFDEVFEDTVDRTHHHDHDQQQFGGHGAGQSLSGDAARILEEAKDLTREMYETADEQADDEDDTRDDEGEQSADDDTDEKES